MPAVERDFPFVVIILGFSRIRYHSHHYIGKMGWKEGFGIGDWEIGDWAIRYWAIGDWVLGWWKRSGMRWKRLTMQIF